MGLYSYSTVEPTIQIAQVLLVDDKELEIREVDGTLNKVALERLSMSKLYNIYGAPKALEELKKGPSERSYRVNPSYVLYVALIALIALPLSPIYLLLKFVPDDEGMPLAPVERFDQFYSYVGECIGDLFASHAYAASNSSLKEEMIKGLKNLEEIRQTLDHSTRYKSLSQEPLYLQRKDALQSGILLK